MADSDYYRLLFYFTGHGNQSLGYDGKIGFLQLSGARPDGSSLQVIDMKQIGSWANNLPNAKQMLFLLDCCFSGLAGVEPKSYDFKESFDSMILESGRYLITAGGEDERSYGSVSNWGGSVFTDVLLSGIKGSADGNGDGIVTTFELYAYVKRGVQIEALKVDREQSPLISNIGKQGDKGEYFFVYKKPIYSKKQSKRGIQIISKSADGVAPADSPQRPENAYRPTF